ncbi:MAG: hypothetical protein OQL19_12280 [Gammaproteobacteria bacterium]|nr:hypothetical protein [Gammaproteobacteria bacterium]
MKQIEDYKTNFIKLHAWKCTTGTNNSVFYNASNSEMNDKKVVFPPKLKESLGLPESINSFYDQKKHSGAYERLWDLTIISLCSDIEYFFKDLFQNLFPQDNFKFGFYQRVYEVINHLEGSDFDFSNINYEINKIVECFQVRHIAIHNMGYIDENFIKKVDSSLQINEKFVITQEIYKSFYHAYFKMLDNIDEHLFREKS